ncbi:RimJ/RimL family protein N-acetyltransferase [Neolewinella xylanilytica]|uniref:RimJ/RimL family protein N-acetyltransferase n=1 Tax=Neolewinella xylanilytica TaxID=1514080 RepID=A0A2S6I9G6_9BACT|nr:GNAT family N-acetyltransferase [Neolewinella xylanilytica]PPK88140.1 RimJ/RimL family protein N-acetyltransferase [Neolewinella xylanilytica]
MDEWIRTPRLILRRARESDAPFFLALLNSPGWLRYIGDRNVRTEVAAAAYIRDRVIPGYDQPGHGSYLVVPKDLPSPVGFVGVFRRDGLPAPDFGFAFLADGQGRGFAYEASQYLLATPGILSLPELLAISLPENGRSIRLLGRLGFVLEGEAEIEPGKPMLRFRWAGMAQPEGKPC